MARKAPLTVRLIDELGECVQQAHALVTADGLVTIEEQTLERELRRLIALAERINEARLDAISYLDHGALNERRRVRHAEMAREHGEPLEAA